MEGDSAFVIDYGLVESALGAAFFQLEGSGFVHGDLQEIAAALCYKITKNHAFADGNKRTAAISSIVFLQLNGWDLEFEEFDFGSEYHMVVEAVAGGRVSEENLKTWFREHAVPLKKD